MGPDHPLVTSLFELLRIPSISTGEVDMVELRRAAEWLRDYITAAGGVASVEETPMHPIVVGELRGPVDAPTVLIYGHYDVQSPGPLELWNTPPFDPAIIDGRLYARGAADDKGNFWPLLWVACEMAREGTLPVNIRILIEGEEERGSAAAIAWIENDTVPTDAAIIFDSGSFVGDAPAITLGTRGAIEFEVNVTVAERDAHSGLYGGIIHNANHVLLKMLAEVMPGPDGRLRPELREGIEPVGDVERESWKTLPSAEPLISEVGAKPLTTSSISGYYEQNWGDASLDINSIEGGEPRTIIPAHAKSQLSMRLAPGQDHERMAQVIKELMLAVTPPEAEVTFRSIGSDAGYFSPDSTVLKIARRALEEVTGEPPTMTRMGATLPLLSPLSKRGIPTILSGFLTPQDAFHAPNESFRMEGLRLGELYARALYEGLAAL